MEFSYYYLIQDISGVLLAAVGLRFIQVYFVIMKNRGFQMDYFLCLIGNGFLVASGVNLVIYPWSLRTWIVSLVLFIIGRLFGTVVYLTMVKNQIKDN